MYGNMSHFFAQAALFLPAFLLILSVHEAAHAGMAYLLGDDTAKRAGRLSLNPLVHIDWVGLLCVLVFRIGWAKPVMFDQRNFKHPKLYSVLTAYAGPISNFILALGAFLCLRFFPANMFSYAVTATFVSLLKAIAWLSTMLGVFNLLPIPPLDGSHVFMVLLMDRYPQVIRWLYRYSLIILVLFLIMPPTQKFLLDTIKYVYNFLQGLVF